MRGVCARVVVVALAALALTCRAGDDADVVMGLEKVVPVAVSSPAVWALFDRSIEQGYVPADGVVAAAFAEVATIDVVKVYGPAPYRLRVTGAAQQSIGFDDIDLSSLSTGWHTFRAREGRGGGAVEVRFEPTVANARIEIPLPELEFWRAGPLTS